jgi:hypothetical protein
METDILKTDDQTETNIVKSLSAVGRHFRVSQPAVSKWKLNGMPLEEDGTYNLTRITAWRALRITREAESLDKVEGIDPGILAEVKKELGRFRGLVETYKLDRGDIFSGAQAKMLSLAEEILDGIKSKDLEKMHIRDRIKALKEIVSSVSSLYHEERLERGESTENVAVIIAAIRDLKKRQFEEEEKAEGERKQSRANEG